MTEQTKAARPSQVTMAGWMAAIGSVLLVFSLFESVSNLRTVQFRETIEEFLATPPGSGMGLEVAQVVEIVRGLMFFSAAVAAAAGILAVYVLQRNNGARIAFTVAAVLLLLTAPASGGFLPILIAVSATWLWTKPARDWFAGIPVSAQTSSYAAQRARSRVEGNIVSSDNNPPQQPEGAGPETGPGAGEAPSPRVPEDSSGRPVPPPTHGFGEPTPPGQPAQQPPQSGQPAYPQGGYPPPPPQYGQAPYGQPQYGQAQGQPQGQPPYGQAPYGQPQYGQPQGQPPYGQPPYGQHPGPYAAPGYPQPPVDPDARPRTVTIAAWITWALSGLTAALFVLVGFVLAVARDEFVDQVEQQADYQQLRGDITTDQLIAAVWVMIAVAVFWSLASMVLAWFAYRRQNWARITLVVSAALAAVASIISFPIGLLNMLGAGAVIALLFMGGANEWYARRSGQQAYPGGFPAYGQPGSPFGQQPGGQQPGDQQYGDQGTPQGQGTPQAQGDDSRRGDEPPSNVW